MPQFGSVYIPDSTVAALQAPAPAPAPGFFATLGAQTSNTLSQLRYGLPLAVGQATGQLTQADQQGYTQKLQEAAKAVAPYQPASVSDVLTGRSGLGHFLSSNAAALIPQAAGMIAGGAIGGAVGGPAGAVAGAVLAGTPGFAGQNVQSIVERDGGLSADKAEKALLVAPFQAGAAEAAGYMTPGLGRFLGSTGEAYTGSLGMRIAKSALATGSTQAAAGAAMEAGTQYASGDLGYNPDSAGKLVDAAVGGFAIGGLLGSLGGFKKAKIDTAPAGDITPDALADQAEKIVSGQANVEPQPFVPAGLLPPPTNFIADSEGNIVPAGPGADRDLTIQRNLPVQSAEPPGPLLPGLGQVQSRVDDILGQSRPAAPEPPLGSQPSLRGLFGFDQPGDVTLPPAPEASAVAPAESEVEPAGASGQRAAPLLADTDKPLIPPPDAAPLDVDAARPFKDIPLADLAVASKRKGALPELADEIERETNLRAGELNGSVPTDDATFQSRLDEAKQGLRGSWVKTLDAKDPQDLLNKVFDEVFENQTQASSTQKLAQRLGILDDKLNPTPWAADVLKQRDDAEQAQIKAERDARRAGATPPAQEAAPAASEVPTQTEEPPAPAKPAPKGKAAPKAEAPSAPEAPNEPVRQGPVDLDTATRLTTMVDTLRQGSSEGPARITGREANELRDLIDAKKFDEANNRLTDILATKEEGKLAPSPENEPENARNERARQEADESIPKDDALPIDKDADAEFNEKEADRANALSDEADRRQAEADDQAQAERDQVDTATTEADQAAIEKPEPAKPAKPPKTQKEAEDAKPAAEKRAAPAKPGAEKPAAPAKPKFDVDQATPLRGRIEALRDAVGTGYKGLTDGQAQALHDLVDKGSYKLAADQIDRLETSRDRAAELAARRPIGKDEQPPLDEKGNPVSDQKLADAVGGKTVAQAAKYLADNAPSRYHRSVFDAVAKLAARLEGPKWESKVVVLKAGDVPPAEVNAIRNPTTGGYSYVATGEDGVRRSTVYLKDPTLAGHAAASYVHAGHELLHAVLMDAIENSRRGRSGDARLDQLGSDLRDLRNAVVKHYNSRIDEFKAGKTELSHIEKDLSNGLDALKDTHELISYGLTDPRVQEYLQSIPYKKNVSVMDGLVNSIRKLLGLDKTARADTALTELMRVSDDILRPDSQQIGAYRGPTKPGTIARAAQQATETPKKADSALGEASKALSDAADKLDIKTAGGVWNNTQKGILYFSSLPHLVRMYGDKIAGTREYEAAHEQRAAISQRLSQLGSQAYVKFEKLSAEAQDRVRNIMGIATEFGLDPTKSLEDHTWLTDAALKTTGVSREQIAELHKQITNDYNTLRRQGEGADRGAGAAVFDEFRAMNDMQALMKLAQSFHTLVGQDELLRGSPLADLDNPVKSFIARMNTGDTAAGVKYFRDLIDAQLKAGSDFLETTRGKLGTETGTAAKAMQATITPLDTMIKGAKSILKGLDEAPYFHLGRSGDFFGTAEITKGEDGYADPESQKAVAKALGDAGFTFAKMSADNRQPRYMIRFDSESDKVAYDKLALQLAKDGHINPETMKSGPRDVAGNFGLNTGTASMVKRLQDGIDNSSLFDERPGMTKTDIEALHAQRSALKSMLSDIWLDAQPDTAIARVMARRETRPGYDKDMAHSWITRWQVGSNAMANLTTMPDITNAMSMLKDTFDKSLHLNPDGTRSANSQTALNVMRELQLREVKTPVNALADKFDKARSWASTYYLGLNPAYVLMQTMQLGTNALPELSKKYGYAKSFAAMRAATGDATAVMRAIMKEMGPLPLLKKADALAVTENALNNANISPELRAFLTRMMATGAIDIGSMARAAQQAGDKPSQAMLTQFGKHAQMVNHLAAMPATGIELYTRLIAAFAAQRLHGDYSLEAQNYASNAVKESMFRFQNYSTARGLGKAGLLGRATPIVAQFMSFSTQMIEKLHGEMTDAFGGARPGESAADVAERKAAARRFLIGHTVAVTALAGTMGVPFATAFAAVLDKSVRASGITGDKDWDATAAYRDFLSTVLGKDVGEIVAHGLPRAIGMDVSSHIGEGGLLPLTDFLASKRSWKDAVGDEASRVGAMPSMFGNIVGGGSQIADGHVLAGMITMLPTGLKNVAKVYQMAETGYVDGKGEKLPMSPTAAAYLSQLLGYTPSQKAEYQEAKADQQERRDILQARGSKIRQDIINGVMNHDPEAVRSGIQRATAFDAANIGYAITPTLGRALQRTVQQHALAVATQSPVGTPIRDVAGQALTRYANWQPANQ